MYTLILFIFLFFVFIRLSSFNIRLSVLEKKFLAQKEGLKVDSILETVSSLDITGQPILTQNKVEVPVFIQEKKEILPVENKFVSWLKDDWLLKLGSLLLLIGLGWFVTYAVMQGWIGEFGRISLGLLIGVVLLGLGSWRIKNYVNQGGIFLVVGSGVILLTIFAAREMYNMFTPAFALTLMFLSTAYISLISVKYNAFAVSLSGLILACIAPLLTNSVQVNEIGLFTYLLVITLGAIWIVFLKKNWGYLIFANLVCVSLYSLPYITDYSSQSIADTLIWFAFGFASLFFLTSIVNIINSREVDIKAFLWTAVGNGAFLLAWIMNVVTEEWQSLVIAFWMAMFAVVSFIAFNVTKIKSVFFIYSGVALAMLLVATTIELEGSSLIIAYIVESFLVPVLIYFTTKDVHASAIGSILVALPATMSVNNLNLYYMGSDILSKDFFVVSLVIIVLVSLGLMYRKVKYDNDNFFIDILYLIVGSVYLYVLLWSVFHVGILIESMAVTFSLVIFTIIGLVKYFYGISVGSKILRNYGGLLIGFVILRLLFIDIWSMEIGIRVFVFILIGILLMSTAFISRQIRSSSV